MKRIVSLLLVFILSAALCIPVMAAAPGGPEGPGGSGGPIDSVIACIVCGEEISILGGFANPQGTLFYTDYFNVETIPGFMSSEYFRYEDIPVYVVFQNDSELCSDCLTDIVEEYKAPQEPQLPEPVTMTTPVTYTGTGSRAFTVTIPETLNPGQTAAIQASGTWASNETLSVTADSSVTLTGSGGGSTTLGITFPGIKKAGNNEYAVSTSANLSVGAFTPLFGTWSGSFQITVSFVGDEPMENPLPEQ